MIGIQINGTKMTPEKISAGTAGSYYETINFSFTGEWVRLNKKAVFYPARGKPVEVDLGRSNYGSTKIPSEVMAHSGIAKFVVSGYVIEDGKIDEKIITTPGFIDVDATLKDEGANTYPPTPNIYEQLEDRVADVEDKTNKVNEHLGNLSAIVLENRKKFEETKTELTDKVNSIKPLIGSTNEITPSMVVESLREGRSISLFYTDETFGDMIFNNFGYLKTDGVVLSSVILRSQDEKDMCACLCGALHNNTWSSYTANIGGTGDGGGYNYKITLSTLMDDRIFAVPKGETVVLKFKYLSVDNDGFSDGGGVGQIIVNDVVKHTFSAAQGINEVDITSYLTAGKNDVSVRVMNSENASKVLSYTITLADAYLTSSFDALIVRDSGFSFTYTPTGLSEKTMHFEIDGTEIGTETVSVSDTELSYEIPAQSHGAHILRAWFTCNIAGINVTSNVLYYSFISIEEGNTTPIIAIVSPAVTSVEQYSNVVTRYRVYNPAGLTAQILLEVNGNEVNNLTVDRTEQTWTYRPDNVGSSTQTIRCGDVSVSWTYNVTKSNIKVEAETDRLALYLSSYGRSNNEDNPGVWEDKEIKCTFENFNFISDGWVQDEDDITVMRVTGDARLTIPYKMFASDFRSDGKTIEFELATREVLDYDAEVLSCYSGARGFKITAQQLFMASEQSAIGTRYKEDEHIRVSIVVDKKSGNRLLLCYINGIMSGAVQYPEDDDFSQTFPVGITIGSNNCTTDIYNIRVYNKNLSRRQVVNNWIADTQNGIDKLERYKRNDVYNDYGQVVISKLPSDLPYMVIKTSTLPQFKDDKKNCSGYFTDPLNSSRSFRFTNAQIDVQGTSSQYYYRKNYKLKFKGGFTLSDGSLSDTYQMNNNAVPTDTFTMKADVASSEGAFNVVLSMLYNELCPYKTPAQVTDSKVRQCIEGFPMVIFWDNGSEVKFLGKYNFNNDKGTEEVFGFKGGDESWEILQNGTARVGWHSADFSGDSWKTDFEARYPDKNTNITRLKALAEWLVSTDTDQATNAPITAVTYDGVEYTTDSKEYRLAKFSAELADHFVEEAIIFYYLFTEIFLSIDQREKNAFPTYLADEDRWIVLFYDADSSCGTDNKGNLTFDYYLEDIDYTKGGDPIYNGQNSVLWKNLRATRFNEIAEMYKTFRTDTEGTVSYEKVIDKFMKHQGKWCEAIFNEDMYTKCLEPLILEGDGVYLPMLQGKKEQWMKWWLYNRFRYLDSKYETGTSMTNRITIRAKSKANVFLKSYVNMYGRVYYNAEIAEHRMERGKEYEFIWAASGAEDAVIGINDADMLTSLGDLSPLKVELINAAAATHITELKIGDGAEDYVNYSTNSITLGNNILLRKLDVRNCPNLTQAIDISGCRNIEEVYFDGSSITGLKLPNGGILKKLHLPATMANLTILNQTSLEEFVLPSYENITTLRLENNSTVIDPLAILSSISENSRVRIIGFDWEMTNAELDEFITMVDSMRGLDENGNNTDLAQLGGRIYVEEVNGVVLNRAKKYVGLTVEYGSVFLNSTRLVERTLSGTYVNDRVTSIPMYAFYGCNNLIEAEFSKVTTIGNSAFRSLNKLTRIVLPELVNTADTSGYSYAFGGCTALVDVEVPKLETLGADALSGCTSIKKLVFPNLINMGGRKKYGATESCLKNCSGLKVVDFSKLKNVYYNIYNGSWYGNWIIRNTDKVVYKMDGNSIGNTYYIYVPKTMDDGSDGISAYESATNWSTCAGRFRYIEDYTVDGTLHGELDLEKMGVSI